MRLGTTEILLILMVVLLLFGANKLPQLGDALGRGIKNFRKATDGRDPPAEPEASTPAALLTAASALPLPHATEPDREGAVRSA